MSRLAMAAHQHDRIGAELARQRVAQMRVEHESEEVLKGTAAGREIEGRPTDRSRCIDDVVE